MEKFSAVLTTDVRIPTSDACELALTRNTQPEPDLILPLDRLTLTLPARPPPKITAVPVSCRPTGAIAEEIRASILALPHEFAKA